MTYDRTTGSRSGAATFSRVRPIVACLAAWVIAAAVGRLAAEPAADARHLGGPAAATVPTTAWAEDPLWDDGRAEVARYAATETIYGRRRDHEAILLTVKEDFHPPTRTKADWPYGERPVVPAMKTNLVEDVPTENYPYRGMTSVFAPRADVAAPMKVSVALHEWCGNTYKELRFDAAPGGARLVFHTYWEEFGSGEEALDAAQLAALPEDQLMLAVRAFDGEAIAARRAAGEVVSLALLPTLRGPRLRSMRPRGGEVEAARDAGREDGAAAWRFTIRLAEDEAMAARTMVFVVAEDRARTLLAADFGDGRTYRLLDATRAAYWERP